MTIAYQHLTWVPSEGGGNTEIAGKGIRVYTILDLRESGDKPEEIADAYNLPLGAVYEALAYAADHCDEMNEIRQVEAALYRENMLRIPEEVRRGIALDLP